MNPKAKNMPEFLALIERYESIELGEIEEVFIKHGGSAYRVSRVLTGFGAMSTCTLCQKAMKHVSTMDYIRRTSSICRHCVYGPKGTECLNHKTFNAVYNAPTPLHLLAAYRQRAKFMRTLLETPKTDTK